MHNHFSYKECVEKHLPYFCFPLYKRLYRSSYSTQSLVELLPILHGFSTKVRDIIRKFKVMERNLERVTHVEQKIIESSLVLH